MLGHEVIIRSNTILRDFDIAILRDFDIDIDNRRGIRRLCATFRGVAMLYTSGSDIDEMKAIYKYRVLQRIAPPSFSLKLPEKSNKVVYISDGREIVVAARVYKST